MISDLTVRDTDKCLPDYVMYPDVENNVDSSSTWINDDDNYVLVSSGGTHQTFVHLDEAQEIVDSRDDEDPYAGPHITQGEYSHIVASIDRTKRL